MGSREFVAYGLILVLLTAAALLLWRAVRNRRRTTHDERHLRIDLTPGRRSPPQPGDPDGSR